MKNISSINDELLLSEDNFYKDLRENGFIIDDDTNEIELLEYSHFKNKFNQSQLNLVIGVTLDCNFRCPYCYERRQSGALSYEMQNKIIQLVEANAKQGKRINITWYGGEPTLYMNIIKHLSYAFVEICARHNVDYSAGMISNGYLIDEECAKLIGDLNIRTVQITIDGPPDIHNKRRSLPNGDETFNRIVAAIKLLQQKDIFVSIRVNVDKQNEDLILSELIDILKDRSVNLSGMYLGHVKVLNDKYEIDNCVSLLPIDFIKKNIIYTCNNVDLNDSLLTVYPRARSVYCGAQQDNSFVIDSNGYLYKCWDDIGFKERAYSNLNDNKINCSVLTRYMLESPFTKNECRDCFFLPTCIGGCPSLGFQERKKCEIHTYGIDDIIYEAHRRLKTSI